MPDQIYQKFVARWQQVTDLPAQSLGPLTPFYKEISKRLKIMPWPFLVIGSLLIAIGLYLFFGTGIVFLVTLLQRGF